MADELDKQFLNLIMPFIVKVPDSFKVERKIDERGILLELTVSNDDMRHVIGKQGATIKAIRQLISIVGARANLHVSLKVLEPVN